MVINLLYKIFSSAWEDGEVPEDWYKAITKPVYKQKGNKYACSDYKVLVCFVLKEISKEELLLWSKLKW